MNNVRIVALAVAVATVSVVIFEATTHAADTERAGLVFLSADEFARIPVKHVSARILTTGERGGGEFRPLTNSLKNFVPPVRDQGESSSCVGWAVGYYARTIIANHRGSNPSGAFSPAFIYNNALLLQPHATNSACEAISVERGLLVLKGAGSLPWKKFSDDGCSRVPTDDENYAAKTFAIKDWGRADSRESVLNSIADRIPVIVSIQYHSDFLEYKGGVYEGHEWSQPVIGAHALVIIGYDDLRRAYQIVNSWGTGWGEKGFGWISYDSLDRMATTADAVHPSMYHAYILEP